MNDTGLLPNCFIIGAAKSGTTSLYKHLSKHPQIFFPKLKEPHYFTQIRISRSRFEHAILDRKLYLDLYAQSGSFLIRGDASPSYLWSAEAAERIARAVPNAYIIAILRDPIERAYSHYLMDVRANRQQLPFFEALLKDASTQHSRWGYEHLYIELGLYAQQLQVYYELFPRNQILILLYEDLKNNPTTTLLQTFDFLNVRRLSFSHNVHKAYNPFLVKKPVLRYLHKHKRLKHLYQKLLPLSWRATIRNRFLMQPGPKPPMDLRAKAFLQEIYDPEIKALERLLHRPLPELRISW